MRRPGEVDRKVAVEAEQEVVALALVSVRYYFVLRVLISWMMILRLA